MTENTRKNPHTKPPHNTTFVLYGLLEALVLLAAVTSRTEARSGQHLVLAVLPAGHRPPARYELLAPAERARRGSHLRARNHLLPLLYRDTTRIKTNYQKKYKKIALLKKLECIFDKSILNCIRHNKTL